MARKKVKLAWIANDSTRRATFKKRKKGLMKKAHELSTLCDVKTCVVVYGPQESQPEVWPSTAESQRVLTRFKSMPEMEQSKKMVDQEGFLRQRISKTQEQLHRLERENFEFETSLLMHDALTGQCGLDGVAIREATMLAWLIELRLKAVQERIQRMLGAPRVQSSSNVLPAAASAPVPSQTLILPSMLPAQMPTGAGPADATNVPALPETSSSGTGWYINPGDSISFGRTDELMAMQPYLDATSAWNDYLHFK